MATIERFEDLECWKAARELCKVVFNFTSREPFSSDYKLRNQINDSSSSAMSNISEGFERNGNREFINFLAIAKGSAGETRSHLYSAYDRNYITADELKKSVELAESVSKLTQGLITYLNNSEYKGSKFSVRSASDKVGENEPSYGNLDPDSYRDSTLNFEP